MIEIKIKTAQTKRKGSCKSYLYMLMESIKTVKSVSYPTFCNDCVKFPSHLQSMINGIASDFRETNKLNEQTQHKKLLHTQDEANRNITPDSETIGTPDRRRRRSRERTGKGRDRSVLVGPGERTGE